MGKHKTSNLSKLSNSLFINLDNVHTTLEWFEKGAEKSQLAVAFTSTP